MKTIHIHEVLHMLANPDKTYTENNLVEEVKKCFGEDIQFTSCSNNYFAPEQIIDFMIQRGKIVIHNGEIILAGQGCDH